MNRQELLEVRKNLFDLYAEKKRLGEFDAHATTITEILKILIDLTDHSLDQMKAKDVHGKAKSTTG